MRVIAIEEHFLTVEIRDATASYRPRGGQDDTRAKLDDLGERRLADMDAAGIDVSTAGSASTSWRTSTSPRAATSPTPPLLCALMVLGADRIMFSVDYPFSDNTAGRAFLDRAPISAADREKIAHGNAERLLRM